LFTEPLLRNELHNPVGSPLLGADDIENTASSIAVWWNVFTELLPGTALINLLQYSLMLLRRSDIQTFPFESYKFQ
jgi:hypothetical protein